MAWKGFNWIRAILAIVGLVAKETKTTRDDKVVEVAGTVTDVAEAVEDAARKGQE